MASLCLLQLCLCVSLCDYESFFFFMYMRCVRGTAGARMHLSLCVCEWAVFASVINPGQTTEAL